MLWNIAVHSISWGHRPLKDILSDAKSAGFAGVELFQHPEELGGAQAIVAGFAEFGLHLVGITSGSFDDRCALVRQIAEFRRVKHDDPSLPYVYVDEWREQDSRFKRALDDGLRIALHPHMYKPVQTLQEAEAILAQNPRLRFLPDVAHLKIAGEDPINAINKHFARLDAIHLKDWREDVGRSYQFYARGFCELGAGDVDLRSILYAILQKRFAGWLVVEQDSTADPLGSAMRSFAWLQSFLKDGAAEATT